LIAKWVLETPEEEMKASLQKENVCKIMDEEARAIDVWLRGVKDEPGPYYSNYVRFVDDPGLPIAAEHESKRQEFYENYKKFLFEEWIHKIVLGLQTESGTEK
jgi:hypothetical protein